MVHKNSSRDLLGWKYHEGRLLYKIKNNNDGTSTWKDGNGKVYVLNEGF